MIQNYHWRWCQFEELTNRELYQLLQARQDVFVVEQTCIYRDLDDKDFSSWHLLGYQDSSQNELAAYLRVTLPGVRFEELSLGRVLTTEKFRGKGSGKALTQKALEILNKIYPKQSVRISAQQYLEKFYQSFGFQTVSEPYLEDDIPHIEMLLTYS